MLAFDFIKEGLYWLYEGIFQIFYFVWRCIAVIVDIMESVFQMLIGLKPIKSAAAKPIEQSGVDANAPTEFNDLPSWIINQPVIKVLFQNLAIFAVILLMFFTIIVIIREQYKNKDGANPYMIVFRTFKGMIMLLFVTAAVLVGLYASGVILNGLNKITKLKDDDSVSGQIFYAMAQRANRYNFYSADPEEVAKTEATEYLDVVRAKRKQEIMQDADGVNPTSPYYFVDSSPVLEDYKVENAFVPYLVAQTDFTVEERTYSYLDREPGDDSAEGRRYRLVQSSVKNVTNDVPKFYPTKSGEYSSSSRDVIQPTGFTYLQETVFETEEKAYDRWRTMLSKMATYQAFIEDATWNSRDVYDMSTFLTYTAQNCVAPTIRSVSSHTSPDKVGKFTIWIPKLQPQVLAYATGDETALKANWNERKKQADFVKKTATIKVARSNSNQLAVYNDFPTAAKVDAQMMRKYRDGMDFNVYLYRADGTYEKVDTGIGYQVKISGEVKFLGPMTYFSGDAVIAFYDLTYFNFIIGFLGILMVAGVYFSFVFGLLQRAMQLVVLYVLSPLTIAVYPFDDGASFSNNFVRPFYRQVISIYAVVLSLNVFFLIYPVFNRITFFEPLGANGLSTNMGDYLMQIFITLAVVGMLPKMRSTITGMLGADSIEERGIGQVFNDARAATWRNQNFKDIGNAAKYAATTAAKPYRGYKKYSAFKEANQPKAYAAMQEKLNDKVRRGVMSQEEANEKLKAFRKKQVEGGAISQAMGKFAQKTGLAKAGRAIDSVGQSLLKSNLGQALFDQNNGALKDWKMVKFVRENSAAEQRKLVKKIRDGQLEEEIELARSHGTRVKAATGLGQEFEKVSEVNSQMENLKGNLKTDPSTIKTAKDYDNLVENLKLAGEVDLAKFFNNRKDDYFKAQSSITSKSAELGISTKQAQAMGAAYSNMVGAGRAARYEAIKNDPKNHGKSSDEITKLKQDSDFQANQAWTSYVESINADKITSYSDAQDYAETIAGVYAAAGAEKTMEAFGDVVTKFKPDMRAAFTMDPEIMRISRSDNPYKFQEIAEQFRMLAKGDWDNDDLKIGGELREYAKTEFAKPDGDKVRYNFEKLASAYDLMGSTTGPMTGTMAGNAHNVAAYVYDAAISKQQEITLAEQRNMLNHTISNATNVYESSQAKLAAMPYSNIIINGQDIMKKVYTNGLTGRQIIERSLEDNSIHDYKLSEARNQFFDDIRRDMKATSDEFRTALSQMNRHADTFEQKTLEYSNVVSALDEIKNFQSKQKSLWEKE